MEKKDFTLGKLYSGIRADKKIENDEEKTRKYEDPTYVKICKKIYKRFPNFGKAKKFKPDIDDAVKFLDWKLKPKVYDSAVKTISIFSIVFLFIVLIVSYFVFLSLYNSDKISYSPMVLTFGVLLVLGGIIAGIIYYFMNYPLTRAKKEQRLSLVYLPEVVGYMTMSLKLVPNLERAVKFAALQGKGKLAEDLRKILWNVNIGIYNNVEEALDELAYKWKKFSPEFKEAIMMIKSAMIEDSDARREELLDKTMSVLLDAIKIKMDTVARGLSQPSLVLFYVGILLPLLLVIILPIGAVFANLSVANVWSLALVYDVFLPLFVFLYARHVIKGMPALYKPPTVPYKYKGLPKKGHMRIGKLQINLKIFVAIVFIIGILLSIFLQINFGVTLQSVMKKEQLPQKYIDNPDAYFQKLANDSYMAKYGKPPSADVLAKETLAQKKLFLMQPGHDTTPFYIIYGFALTLALVIFLYFFFDSYYRRKIQKYYINMEQEFKETLYILASRLGEGKPMEQALKSTKQFFSDLTVSQDLYAKTIDNLNLLGLPLEQAFFDPTFGSLRYNPSMLINNNIRLIVGATQLGVKTAAKTILAIIMQIKNIDEIKELVKKVTLDIIQMMNTMTTMIAPAVLGITVSMEKIVVTTLNSLASSGSFSSSASNTSMASMNGMGSLNPSQLMGSFQMSNISNIASPFAFNIIVIIYVVLLVLILSYYTSNLQENNELAMKQLMAFTVPVAVVIFILSSLGAKLLLGG